MLTLTVVEGVLTPRLRLRVATEEGLSSMSIEKDEVEDREDREDREDASSLDSGLPGKV